MVERRLVGPYNQRLTLTDGARPSKSVTSSHESCAGSARVRTDRKGRKGEIGTRDNGEKRKQHLTRCLPLSNHNSKYNTHSSSGSSKRRNGSAAACRPQMSSSWKCWLPKLSCSSSMTIIRGCGRELLFRFPWFWCPCSRSFQIPSASCRREWRASRWQSLGGSCLR